MRSRVFDDQQLAELFAAVDELATDRFVDFLCEDAVFRFGSAEPVNGRAAIRTAVDAFFASIAGCRHELLRTWRDGSSLACEGSVSYRRHDGTQLTLPFVNVFLFGDGRIRDYRIYVDIAPLYAA